jgi:hypothetical protein
MLRKEPLLPHILCSAISPSGKRMFVPISLQEHPSIIEFITQDTLSTWSLDRETITRYNQTISEAVAQEDFSELERNRDIFLRSNVKI